MKQLFAIIILLGANCFVSAENSTERKVYIGDFVRAETDNYFRIKSEYNNGTGNISHNREPVPIDRQTVVRPNRDTLYSSVIFDLTEPVTVTMPDAGNRYLSLQIINQDHYIKHVSYTPGRYTFTADDMGSRYIQVIIRLLIDPDDKADIAQAHDIQDQIQIDQKSKGSLDLPNWDRESLVKVRDSVISLRYFLKDTKGMFGDAHEINPIKHVIGTAGGFGGMHPRDATYYTAEAPDKNDNTHYQLTLNDVPADGFWSVSIYNDKGYFESNDYDSYSLNSYTALKVKDGSVTINFGGDPEQENYLHTMPGWNYSLRLFKPRTEVLNGKWTAPVLKKVSPTDDQ